MGAQALLRKNEAPAVALVVTLQPTATQDVKIGKLALSALRWYVIAHAVTEGEGITASAH